MNFHFSVIYISILLYQLYLSATHVYITGPLNATVQSVGETNIILSLIGPTLINDVVLYYQVMN